MSKSKQFTLIIVEDHPMFRSGLRLLIETFPRITIVGEYNNGETALEVLREQQIDIAIVDVDMPKMNGIELIKKCKELNLTTSLIFLTVYNEKSLLFRLMDYGAKAYLLKETATEEMQTCLTNVAHGELFVSTSLQPILEQWKSQGEKQPSIDILTTMEKKVLGALAQLKTNKEIADAFFISEKTVENHRTNIAKKLNIQGTHALLKYAIEQKPFL